MWPQYFSTNDSHQVGSDDFKYMDLLSSLRTTNSALNSINQDDTYLGTYVVLRGEHRHLFCSQKHLQHHDDTTFSNPQLRGDMHIFPQHFQQIQVIHIQCVAPSGKSRVQICALTLLCTTKRLSSQANHPPLQICGELWFPIREAVLFIL